MSDAKTLDSEKNWVDRLPLKIRPYARMIRLDRPIGSWLLFIPCSWGLTLAAVTTGQSGQTSSGEWPSLYLLALFALGAVIMRGAGCIFNDIVDRELDAQVARTRQRPIPAGLIKVWQAWLFLFVMCLLGLIILLQLDIAAIALGFMSIGPIALYPFMKRITWWPQLFLGLTFNWGALMGYAAHQGSLDPAAIGLYAAGIFWTLGYDTIYAHQDREDDALAGIKSSARWLGSSTKTALVIFYSATLIALLYAAFVAGLSGVTCALLMLGGVHLFWQIYRLDIDNPTLCLYLFKSNRNFGLYITAALLSALYI